MYLRIILYPDANKLYARPTISSYAIYSTEMRVQDIRRVVPRYLDCSIILLPNRTLFHTIFH